MKQLVSGSADNCIMLWSFKPQLRAFRFVGHKGPVNHVEVSTIEIGRGGGGGGVGGTLRDACFFGLTTTYGGTGDGWSDDGCLFP